MGKIAQLRFTGRAIPWMTVLLATTQFGYVILAPLQQTQDTQKTVEDKVAFSKTAEVSATKASGVSTHTSTSTNTVNNIDLRIKNSFQDPGNCTDQDEKKLKDQILLQTATANVATRNEMSKHGSATSPSSPVRRRWNFPMLGSDSWNRFTSSERRERRLPEDFTKRRDNHERSLPYSDEFRREIFTGLGFQTPTLPPTNSEVPEFKAIDLNLLNDLMAKNHLFSPQNSKRPQTTTDSEKDINGLSSIDSRSFPGNFNTKDDMILQNSDENTQRNQFIKSGIQNDDTVGENMEMENMKGRRQFSAGAISSEVLDQMEDQSDAERRQTKDKLFSNSNNENDLLSQVPNQKEIPVITGQFDPNTQDELNENLLIDVRDIMKSFKNKEDTDNFLSIFKDFHDAPHSNKNLYLQFAIFVKLKLQTFLNALGLSSDMNVNGTMSTPSKTINPVNKEQLSDKPDNVLGSRFQPSVDVGEPVDLNQVDADLLPSPAFRRPTKKMPDSLQNFFLRPVAVKKANSSKETNERVNQITIDSNSKRGRSVCNYQRLNLKMLLEYFHTGKMCGSHIVRMRFGIGK